MDNTRLPEHTPSNIHLEEEEIVDDLINDGYASMPKQVKRPNAWNIMTYLNMYKDSILTP